MSSLATSALNRYADVAAAHAAAVDLQVTYCDVDGVVSERRISPVRVRGGKLLAFCHDKVVDGVAHGDAEGFEPGVRSLRMDRILGLRAYRPALSAEDLLTLLGRVEVTTGPDGVTVLWAHDARGVGRTVTAPTLTEALADAYASSQMR